MIKKSVKNALCGIINNFTKKLTLTDFIHSSKISNSGKLNLFILVTKVVGFKNVHETGIDPSFSPNLKKSKKTFVKSFLKN